MEIKIKVEIEVEVEIEIEVERDRDGDGDGVKHIVTLPPLSFPLLPPAPPHLLQALREGGVEGVVEGLAPKSGAFPLRSAWLEVRVCGHCVCVCVCVL